MIEQPGSGKRRRANGNRAVGWPGGSVRAAGWKAWLLATLLILAGGGAAQAQSTEWQTGTQVERKAPAKEGGATQNWGDPANLTVVPRSGPDAKAAGTTEVSLAAVLTEDGEPIDQGLVWRIFQPVAPGPGAALAKPKLTGTWRDAAPVVRLAPGEYLVNVAFGRAHLTRRITVAAGKPMTESFVLNAGGLRVSVVLPNGERVPANSVSFEVFAGETDQLNPRNKIISGAKPGLIVRLNAGLYQLVSTYGDANSVVHADVSVEAGKLSEAVITHQAAKVTFRLVSRAGGEAIADTQWIVRTPQGEVVRESMGALPNHILAAGTYVVSAKNGDKLFRREVKVVAGDPMQVEIVMQ